MITLCDKKRLRITGPLYELEDNLLVCEHSRTDLIPKGTIIDTEKVSLEWPHPRKGYYVMNKKDLINFRDDHVRASGCCGADGRDLNIASSNGLPVGYEHGDCYMPHFVLIPKQNIIEERSGDNSTALFLFAVSEVNKRPVFIDRIMAAGLDDAYKLEALARKTIVEHTEDKKVRSELLDKMYVAELGQVRYIIDKVENVQALYLDRSEL